VIPIPRSSGKPPAGGKREFLMAERYSVSPPSNVVDLSAEYVV
jgi:hypothetical protein